MLNRWIGIGRLTRDPELAYGTSGTAICKFTLAVNRKFKKDETDFIDIVCFKGTAENSAQYLTKGSLCAVEGSIQVGSYENKEGQKRKTFEVVASDVRFLDSKKSSNDSPAPPKDDQWSDIGRQIKFDDIGNESETIPF